MCDACVTYDVCTMYGDVGMAVRKTILGTASLAHQGDIFSHFLSFSFTLLWEKRGASVMADGMSNTWGIDVR